MLGLRSAAPVLDPTTGKLPLLGSEDEFFYHTATNSGQRAPSSRRLERLDCLALVFRDVEHGVKRGDLQEIVDILAEIHQLELAALIAN